MSLLNNDGIYTNDQTSLNTTVYILHHFVKVFSVIIDTMIADSK